MEKPYQRSDRREETSKLQEALENQPDLTTEEFKELLLEAQKEFMTSSFMDDMFTLPPPNIAYPNEQGITFDKIVEASKYLLKSKQERVDNKVFLPKYVLPKVNIIGRDKGELPMTRNHPASPGVKVELHYFPLIHIS